MRDEKQQQHRVILQYTTDRYCATVKNNWENLFFPCSLFCEIFMPIFREQSLTHWQLRKGKKKKDTTPSGEEKKTHKQDDIVVIRALNGSTADKATNYKG